MTGEEVEVWGAGRLRVLDLSSSLGGLYATRLLAAGGAAIVRVEDPGGHRLRGWSASHAVVPDGGTGAVFRWLAGGQRSVVVDPDVETDLASLRELAAGSDAILWTPGSPLSDGPFGVEDLRRVAPAAVLTAITSFGLDGPWSDRPATEFTLQALSGGPALRGSRAWPPLSTGGQHGEWMVGAFGALATLIGVRHRVVTGGAPLLDVSALESVIMTQLFNPITMETIAPPGRGYAARAKAKVGDIVASKDGWVGFAVVNRVEHWHALCRMIGRPDWAEDPSLDPVANRSDRADELNPVIERWARERTTAEIVELATQLRIPTSEVGNGATIPKMEHFAAAGFYEVNPDGGFVQPAPPFRFHPPLPDAGPTVGSSAPVPIQQLPVRRIATDDRSTSPPRASAGRPFDGIRVADFTSFWAGPFMAHTLAMFGADVIHVESPARPDGARLMNVCPRTEPRWWEWSPYFQATNTNKRSLTLDMDQQEGRELARRLIAQCDVLVENFSPRVMERWGLAWDDVRAIRPDLIMVRMPAFGLTGPWRDRTGFAMTMEQVSGMAWLTGFPDGPPNSLFGPCDPSAGVHAAIATLVAIEQRRRDGAGRLVEVPMVGQALNVAGEQVVEHSAHGALLVRDGNRGAAAAPQGCYRTATPDADGEGTRWVAIAVATDEQWRGLRQAVAGQDWAAAADLETAAGRRRRHDDLDDGLGRWCATREVEDIVEVLTAAGVPVAPVVHPIEQLGFEQLYARQFFESVDHPLTGGSTHVTYPFAVLGSDGPVHRRPAPCLGEHNAEVLRELLGLAAEEIHDLEDRGIIGDQVRPER